VLNNFKEVLIFLGEGERRGRGGVGGESFEGGTTPPPPPHTHTHQIQPCIKFL